MSYPAELRALPAPPKRNRYHERYHLFACEMKVKIKDQFRVMDDCDEQALKVFERYKGYETIIQTKYTYCCTLQIDGGRWTWSYDWIEPFYLESELFEI